MPLHIVIHTVEGRIGCIDLDSVRNGPGRAGSDFFRLGPQALRTPGRLPSSWASEAEARPPEVFKVEIVKMVEKLLLYII